MLLVPGTFTARTFWLGPEGKGFASALASRGCDVWILEPRGHGASERPEVWRMTDWIEHDAPAAAELLLGETGASVFHWVGHSAGGVVGAAFSGTDHPAARRLGSLVLFGSPGPGGVAGVRRWLARGAGLLSGLAPRVRVPGEWLGLGPEPEPAALIREWMGWNLAGAWRNPRGEDYLAALGGVRLPVLALAGAGDRMLAPPHAVEDLLRRFGSAERQLMVVGTQTGYSRDVGHAGLVIGRAAREEVWPRVLSWIERRACPAHEENGEARRGGPS